VHGGTNEGAARLQQQRSTRVPVGGNKTNQYECNVGTIATMGLTNDFVFSHWHQGLSAPSVMAIV
jgi:hypothetical protein